MSNTSTLSSLLSILSSSVAQLEAAYAKHKTPYPSLDTPFSPTSLDIDPEVDGIARLAVAAAGQLIATIRAPLDYVQEYATSTYAAASLNLVVDVHVANIVKDSGDKGMHINDIAPQAGVPAERLARVLRYLASRHIFREVTPDVFANNRNSSVLIKKHTIAEIEADPLKEYEGSPAAAFVGHATDESMKGALALSSWIRDSSKAATPFNAGNGVTMDLFQWYEKEEYRGRRFHESMTGVGERFPPSIFVNGFEWDKLAPNSVVVDVGGSVGSVSLMILNSLKNKNLRFIIQDLENVVANDAPKFWEERMPSAVSEGHVQFQAIDFFKSQPEKGAAVYFMRTILHDWPSDKCRTILKIIREAAAPSSKLVVFDLMMLYACEYNGPFADVVNMGKAPPPLLANLGVGLGAHVTLVDIMMMNLFDGQERTIGQFIELGEATGWKLEKVTPGRMNAFVFSPV